MTRASDERSDWSARRARWRVERLDPAIARLPERRGRVHHPGRPRRRASVWRVGLGRVARWQRRRPGRAHRGRPHGEPLREGDGRGPTSTRSRHRPAGRAAVHAGHPSHGLSQPALDDADVRGLRRGRGHQRPVPGAARRPARPGSRSPTTCPRCTATTPTTRRPRASSGRAAWRSSSLADMEVLLGGLPLDRVSTSMTINSPGRADLGDVHRRRREGRRARAPASRARPRTTSSRSSSPRRSSCSRPSHRCAWSPTPSSSGRASCRAGTPSRSAAITSARRARPPSRSWRSRSPTGWPTSRPRCARGLRVDDFAPRLSFFFNSHSDFFEEIAKFRASRRIWHKLMTERYRAENERSAVDALPHPDRRRLAHARSSRSTT